METKLQIGCYIDGSLGNEQENNVRLIELAKDWGFTVNSDWYDTWDGTSELREDQEEELTGFSEEAERFMNEQVDTILPLASWGWQDGDFGLWPNTEPDEDECLKVSDLPSLIMEVNDHGNATLYEVTYKEVWSVV